MAELLFESRHRPQHPGQRVEVLVRHGPRVRAGGAVLMSPHPFLGGDVDNNVLRQMARTLAAGGRPSLCFNYRSVGGSLPAAPGVQRFEYWQAIERGASLQPVIEDAQEAWRRAVRLFTPALAGGYSFGGFIALQLALRLRRALPLLLVAPPLDRHDFSPLAEWSAPSVLILAGADGLEPPPAPARLARRFPRSRIVTIAGADHFFLGHERELCRALGEIAGQWVLEEASA